MKQTNKTLRHIAVLGVTIAFVTLGAASVFAQTLPRARGVVNDFAGVIPPEETRRIEALAQAVRDATGAEIAVATTRTYAPYGSIEQYAVALFEAWGVGQRSEDNGVLVVLALDERRVRIEVGYGLEGALPDGRVGAILDDMVLPAFRESRWGVGMLGGVQGIAGYIASEYDVDLTGFGARVPRAQTTGTGFGEIFFLIVIVMVFGGGRFFWPLLFFGRRRRGFFGGGFGAGTTGSFGSRGGGFSGFGGGRSGGGGASRGF
ncbi:MAG: TPM domain-containing protein [Spirochaetaceae bacterium]|nr:MAG: TPM domain-containing protein [Spirochaetaceae bacterium]